MKLAILVVYVFNQANRRLFDIHLARIRRHTRAEFRIFAAAHKLSPELQRYVASQPEIEIVDCEVPAAYGVRDEHAHCLDRLVDHAMERDFTHFTTLHLDSFPIADGWHHDLAQSLENGAALAAVIPSGYSAGLFWTREFQERHAPRMLVHDAARGAPPRFTAFQAAYPDIDHVETGLGYIYRAWSLGLPWRALRTDDQRKIYGDLLFHLVGATYRTWVAVQPISNRPSLRFAWKAITPAVRLLPVSGQNAVRRHFIDKTKVSREGTFVSKSEEVAMLMEEPDLYVESLRQACRQRQDERPSYRVGSDIGTSPKATCD